jgi:hypothetical protein
MAGFGQRVFLLNVSKLGDTCPSGWGTACLNFASEAQMIAAFIAVKETLSYMFFLCSKLPDGPI